MESRDAQKPVATAQEMNVGESYLAPGLKRLSPEAAKDLLLRQGDADDPEVQQMLDCIDELQGEKGS